MQPRIPMLATGGPGLARFETWISSHRIWQARYFDFNISTDCNRVEKLRYIHRNPIKRGLVEAPEVLRWSSFRAYAYQEKGPVRLQRLERAPVEITDVTTFPQ